MAVDTRAESLRCIVGARTLAQSLLAQLTTHDPFATPRLQSVLRMMDQIEAAVHAGPWPPGPGLQPWGQVGLFAVRELGEIDGGSLLEYLCPLANMLDGYPPEGSGRSSKRA